MRAATATTLGYVRTGDSAVDAMSDAGLKSLMNTVVGRTSVEEQLVQPVDIAADDLAVYPLLYWPVTDAEATPSSATIARLNTYLANGGMILFDKREPGLSAELNTATLHRLTTGLNIPPLEKVPEGHTLRKSFYLLDSFPGRYADGPVWVEKNAKRSKRCGFFHYRWQQRLGRRLGQRTRWAIQWSISMAGCASVKWRIALASTLSCMR